MKWNTDEVICLNNATSYRNSSNGLDSRVPTTFDAWWSDNTVPIYLIFIFLPILNLKDAAFFTKFNSLGTISVFYISFLAIYKASMWGINWKGPMVSSTTIIIRFWFKIKVTWWHNLLGDTSILGKFSRSHGYVMSSIFYSFRTEFKNNTFQLVLSLLKS